MASQWQSALVVLQSHVDVLDTNAQPASGRRTRNKTERHKAVVAIHECLSRRTTISALTAASTYHMVRGPPTDTAAPDKTFLTWQKLAEVLLEAFEVACTDAKSSKTVAKSGTAAIKPDYIRCFRHVVKLSSKHAPPGAIRALTQLFLSVALGCISEPALRAALALDLWQCVRDVLADDANHAMLQPKVLRPWLDVCFEQLTGKGPLYHASNDVVLAAGEVLQILATNVREYDVLSQSSRGLAPSMMQGGDFGFALVCERCCLLLVVAESMPKWQARQLQEITFRTLSTTLADHALDMSESSALLSVINASLKPMLMCWVESKHQRAAVSLARTLLLLAPSEKRLVDEVRRRIVYDFKDPYASALMRAGEDVPEDFVEATAMCFSFREALSFAAEGNSTQGHVIIWLRVAVVIMSARVLKRETSVLVDPRDVFDQCAEAAKTVAAIVKAQGSAWGTAIAKLVRWACNLVNVVTVTATRIIRSGLVPNSVAKDGWNDVYLAFVDMASKISYSNKPHEYASTENDPLPEESLMQSMVLLSGVGLVENSTLEFYAKGNAAHAFELPFPLSRLLTTTRLPSHLELELFRNLVARNGLGDEFSAELRTRLIRTLASLCGNEEYSFSPNCLVDASTAVLGLVRGECNVSEDSRRSSVCARNAELPLSLRALRDAQFFFALSSGARKIPGTGPQLVDMVRAQDKVWKREVQWNVLSTGVFRENAGGHHGDISCQSATSKLAQVFPVSSSLSETLEADLFSLLVSHSDAVQKTAGERVEAPDANEAPAPQRGFATERETSRALRSAVFVGNYLVNGLRLGSISTYKSNDVQFTACANMMSMISTSISRLAKTNVEFMIACPELTIASLSVSCDLDKALTPNGRSESAQSSSSWKSATSAIPEMVEKIAVLVGKRFLEELTSSTKETIAKIRKLAKEELIDVPGMSGNANSNKRQHDIFGTESRKKRRLNDSAAQQRRPAFDENGFPVEEDTCRDRADVEEDESGSEDDFGDQTFRPKAKRRNKDQSALEVSKRPIPIFVLADILSFLVTQSEKTADVVYELLEAGVKKITGRENVLNPDEFERDAVICQLLDPLYVEKRRCVWNVLFSINRPASFKLSGRDIAHVSRLWMKREERERNLQRVIARNYLSEEYIYESEHSDIMKRNHYPLSNFMENTRVMILDSGRKFFELFVPGCSEARYSSSMEGEFVHIAKGLVGFAEYCRTQHALRMPRTTRVAYLVFGLKALVLVKGNYIEGLEARYEEDRSSLNAMLQNLQKAMCKSLCDADAIVRLVASKVVTSIFSPSAFSTSDTESVFDCFLPEGDRCVDSKVVYSVVASRRSSNGGDEAVDSRYPWNLDGVEQRAMTSIQSSFETVGSKARGYTMLMTLAEMCSVREDLLPHSFLQMASKSLQKSGLISAAYFVLVRLSICLGRRSPRELYRSFSRVILPKVMDDSEYCELIYSFPAQLVLDVDHHRDGVLYDWMRDDQSTILSHLLVREQNETLDLTEKFASKLGDSVKEILENNIEAFSLLYPMRLIASARERAVMLWDSVEKAVDGKAKELMHKKKYDVLSALLLSTSANLFCMHSVFKRNRTQKSQEGFLRDTQQLQPPLYDPLIVALAINSHFDTARTMSSISLPRDVFNGSLFKENFMRDAGVDFHIENYFGAIQAECGRQNVAMLRFLSSISKQLDPSLSAQSYQNRVDAYFCVGMLWRMMDSSLLRKTTNERLLFYKLLARGFEHLDTAHDAAWLLEQVQMKVISPSETDAGFLVSPEDLTSRTSTGEHLRQLETAHDRQVYEFLSSVSPTLVSVIYNANYSSTCKLRDIAADSLDMLLSSCGKKELWNVVLCNGPFPEGQHFKEAHGVYQKAVNTMEGAVGLDNYERAVSSLRRLRGVNELRDSSRAEVKGLACLQELRTLLDNPTIAKLSDQISREAWMRSSGDRQPIIELTGSAITALIGMLRASGRAVLGISSIGPNADLSSALTRPQSTSTAQNVTTLTSQIWRAVGDVMNTVGLVHPPFVHLESRHRSIPARNIANAYETVDDGIYLTLNRIVDVLRSDSSIAAECAMKSLLTFCRINEGKRLISGSSEDFGAFLIFLNMEKRTLSTSEINVRRILWDPTTGEEVRFNTLPDFFDQSLWDIRLDPNDDVSTINAKYDLWLRTLCAVMCVQCGSAMNHAFAEVCFSSFELCRDVLPYLLMDIVCDLDSDSLNQVSNFLSRYVLNNPTTPVNILRVFVHAFDVLCQIGLEVTYLKGVNGWNPKPNKGHFNPTFYIFRVEYSDLAQAALRCGASFSAIRYSHLHIDHVVAKEEMLTPKQSRIATDRRYSSCPSREPRVEDVERNVKRQTKPWIREAMQQISERDGMRAFAESDGLAESAVSISRLDGDWFRSLASLGVASSIDRPRSQMMNSSEDGLSTTRSGGVNLQHEMDAFRSFVGIGNLSLATDYWEGLMNRVVRLGLKREKGNQNEARLVDKMNDLRFAAAWKLEQWESPRLIPLKTVPEAAGKQTFCDFHRAVYRVLRCYKTERLSEVREVLGTARTNALRELCEGNSGVSPERISESAAKLRVLHVLEYVTNRDTSRSESNDMSSMAPANADEILRAGIAEAGSDGHDSLRRAGDIRLSQDSEVMLGGFFGVADSEFDGLLPSRDAFNGSILTEDLPVVLMRCIGKERRVAQAAATISARVFSKGDIGAWGRAAACLGNSSSCYLSKAVHADKIAWKLQEARLRWSANDDARSRKQALNAVKDIIFMELGGKASEHSTSDNSDGVGYRQSLDWVSSSEDVERLGFLRSEACYLAANWSLDMRTHEPMDLFETYLDPGLRAAECTSKNSLIGRAHFAMAGFADKQIENIDTYRKSRKYEEMVSSVKETEEHLNRLSSMKEEHKRIVKTTGRRRARVSSEATGTGRDKVGKDLDHFMYINSKQARLDRTRLEKLNDTYRRWQELACKHFAACLRDGSTHDLRAAFRMIALWLDSGDMRESITRTLVGSGEGSTSKSPMPRDSVNVPMSKLLPLASQLFSRLNHAENTRNTSFQGVLAATITKMAGLYPEYCLWQLLALTNATRVSGNDEKMSSLYRGDKGKKDAADDILARLQSQHGDTVMQMKQVADAYIALSEISNDEKKMSPLDISRSALLRLGELRHVPVPTVPLPLSTDERNNDLPHIRGFSRRAGVCAGLSKPLRIKCIGSDGKEYPQMVKGRDDLRGDAVMEQMFTIMNSLLEKDSEASKRNLHIRTYRIIPLSPFSGIMQFVSNTKQFKELLVEDREGRQARGKKGRAPLHDRYRPFDMPHIEIAERAYAENRKYPKNIPKRLRFLTVAWSRFQPVFRYFFLEEWPDPADWFTHQLNYSRSVAVMSIVGFILGLGDRHLCNILLDVHTAEVVHIDFGIAFEGGKLLPTPEHMPFRLTRDFVDGFGVAGVEGVFRRCCEITLMVMRKHKDVLLTVVEVLLHDPMFNWALTPEEILKEQMAASGGHDDRGVYGLEEESEEIDAVASKVKRDVSGSREAQRALNRISEKLEGLEGTERLSVEAHVARLVDEAQAFHVVAPVFPGWTPWI